VGGGGSPWGQAARGHPDSLRNVRGPTSSATCVASSLPSLVAATLGDRAGQDQEEEGQSRDRQKVPATAACAATAAAAAAAATATASAAALGLAPNQLPSTPRNLWVSGRWFRSWPPAISPKEQGHEKVRLGQGMQGWGWGHSPLQSRAGKVGQGSQGGKGFECKQTKCLCPLVPEGLSSICSRALSLSLTAPFLGFYASKPPKPPIPLTCYPVPSCA
jgi:hypothetical protein